MNNLGRGNWFLMFVFLVIGMAVLVSSVAWNGAQGSVYNVTEDTVYYHNLSANVTDYNASTMTFEINDVGVTKPIWDSQTVNYTDISDWIILNESTGNLTFNAIHDNQTGNYILHLIVKEGDDSTGTNFEFNISSVNDAPDFTTLDENYTFDESSTPHAFDINASDEEGEYDGTGYPLNWLVNVTSCDYSSSSSRTDGEDCNDLLLSNSSVGNTTYRLNITATDEFVGTYNLTLRVNDSNSETERNVTFVIQNVNDVPSITFACDNNRNMTEDDTMSCWINATDIDESVSLNFSILSDLDQFTFNNSLTTYEYSCVGVSGQCNASANVTFVLNDSAVGNWSVNISVTDTGAQSPVDWENFSFFVNNIEDPVYVDDVVDFTAFENTSKSIIAYDDDFYVSGDQTDVKFEKLNFTSNNSNYVYFKNDVGTRVGSLTNLQEDGSTNHKTVTAYVDWDAMNSSELETGNETVINISVVDTAGNLNYTIFTITFDQSNSPLVWNNSADYDFLIQEDNATWGGINLSEGYVTDADDENITYYYTNDTQFDNFNLSNSTGSWIINFTSTNIDVGYHNVTVYASDGNINVTKAFNFTINYVNDLPFMYYFELDGDEVVESDIINMTSDVAGIFILKIEDKDFIIPDDQVTNGFYNESLIVNVTVINSTNGLEVEFDDEFEFSFAEVSDSPADGSVVVYNVSLDPLYSEVGYYNVTINITDNSSASITFDFYLNITESSNWPVLENITDQPVTIYDVLEFNVSANDTEDYNNNIPLNYSIVSLNDSAGAPDLTIGITNGSVFFNMSSNSSYAGLWQYNVTVNDSTNKTDSQIVYIYVYGLPNVTAPPSDYQFNWSEDNVTGDLDFNVSYAINNTNLTYVFYLDNIVYSNSTAFDYVNTTMISSDNLRNSTTWNWTQESNYSWNFTPGYSDETYGGLKNLTLYVYNTEYPELNDSINWKVNVTHINQNVSFDSSIPPLQNVEVSEGSTREVDLTSYFSDTDYWDNYFDQNVNFTINHVSGSVYVSTDSLVNDDWILTLTLPGDVDILSSITESLSLTAFEWNESNVSIGNATSNVFDVTFIPATVQIVTKSSGGGTTTKLKHFSLKLIAPQDVIISDKGFIDIPFSVQNNGQTDLKGIYLSSMVRFNDLFSDDVKISLGDNYIEDLKFGEVENFSMRIVANTQRAGKYKATIFANVTSPKFEDFADFFVEIKKANESEAEQMLIFTNKFIADNSECLELTELFKQADEAFALGEYSNAMRLAQEVTEACEDSISANEQIRYSVEGFVRDNIYNVSFFTLVIFFMGFVFYIYKRVRFNKSEMDEYV